MEKYQRITYLIGCYMVVADKEINAFEVEVLEGYLPSASDEDLQNEKRQIFSDDEDKPALSNLLSELKLINLTALQKAEVITLLADIAYGDDYMTDQEQKLLMDVARALNIDAGLIIKESEIRSKERIESQRLSMTQRTVGKAENILYNLILGRKSDNVVDLLLGSLGYSASIEEITDIALVDLERVSKIVDEINSSLIETSKTLGNMSFETKKSSKEVNEVAKIVRDIKTHFDNLINSSVKDNREVLDKKRRNIRYFTIAFMGRTKAGKSTLHKVITAQKNDDIGVGKLRTTRYNRSWYWNKLRIVDTPGIGAPGGATDTEIAKSIIDEADVICYIVTSDSIQETEFDFFDTIKERNKPLYIVLNVKSNLTQPIRLKRFLENPNGWKTDDGPQSIRGHLDRIHERLDGKYNMDAVEIIPLHLLAALLGFSNDYSKEDSARLQEGSNIFTFTRSIKATVHKSGGLKKSLSVVDGTAFHINRIIVSLNQDFDQLRDGHNTLVKKANKFKTFMESEKKQLLKDIRSIFTAAKSDLHNRASAFASENYDNGDASAYWASDRTVKTIYTRMNSRLQQRIDDFNERVKSHIEEIADDIQIIGAFKAKTDVSGVKITNTKLGASIFGAILTAAAPMIVSNLWNPAGWILAGVTVVVGMVVSFFTSLFTSKAEKIRKATEKMRDQLCSEIDKGIADNQRRFTDSANKSINVTTSVIFNMLNTYIAGTDKIIHDIEKLCEKCHKGESAINSLISFRILEHIGKKKVRDGELKNIDNDALISRYPVVRDWADQSITYKYKVSLSAKEIDKICKATQMKIRLG